MRSEQRSGEEWEEFQDAHEDLDSGTLPILAFCNIESVKLIAQSLQWWVDERREVQCIWMNGWMNECLDERKTFSCRHQHLSISCVDVVKINFLAGHLALKAFENCLHCSGLQIPVIAWSAAMPLAPAMMITELYLQAHQPPNNHSKTFSTEERETWYDTFWRQSTCQKKSHWYCLQVKLRQIWVQHQWRTCYSLRQLSMQSNTPQWNR